MRPRFTESKLRELISPNQLKALKVAADAKGCSLASYLEQAAADAISQDELTRRHCPDGFCLSVPVTRGEARALLDLQTPDVKTPAELLRGWILERLAPGEAAPPPPTSSPAATEAQPAHTVDPGADYAEMVHERSVGMINQKDKYKAATWLNLPGLLTGWHSTSELFAYAMRAVYFEADKIRSGLSPHLGSDWALVDLEQLICIGDTAANNHSEHLPTGKDDAVKVYRRESQCLPMLAEHTLAEVTAFGAYTLHWFAPAISRWVLPKLELTNAVMLAEALVISERLVGMFSGDGLGRSREVDKLTALERRACELTARLWREWPKDLTFDHVLEAANPKPGYLERRAEAMTAGSNVAA